MKIIEKNGFYYGFTKETQEIVLSVSLVGNILIALGFLFGIVRFN